MFIEAGSVIIIILVVVALLYLGITTGMLWTILGGLFSLIGNCIWELLKAIGSGLGSLLGNILSGILSGISAGFMALIEAIGLPVLIVGLVVFTCLMIWRAFFS